MSEEILTPLKPYKEAKVDSISYRFITVGNTFTFEEKKDDKWVLCQKVPGVVLYRMYMWVKDYLPSEMRSVIEK